MGSPFRKLSVPLHFTMIPVSFH